TPVVTPASSISCSSRSIDCRRADGAGSKPWMRVVRSRRSVSVRSAIFRKTPMGGRRRKSMMVMDACRCLALSLLLIEHLRLLADRPDALELRRHEVLQLRRRAVGRLEAEL